MSSGVAESGVDYVDEVYGDAGAACEYSSYAGVADEI